MEGVPLDELAVDDRGKRLLAGHRDAMGMIQKFSGKVRLTLAPKPKRRPFACV